MIIWAVVILLAELWAMLYIKSALGFVRSRVWINKTVVPLVNILEATQGYYVYSLKFIQFPVTCLCSSHIKKCLIIDGYHGSIF